MNQKNLSEYLLPFIRKSSISDIAIIIDKGAIKYDYDLVNDIRMHRINVSVTDTMLQSGNFDVRTDNLIRVFYVKDSINEYYVFIGELLELFESDYLIGILQINQNIPS